MQQEQVQSMLLQHGYTMVDTLGQGGQACVYLVRERKATGVQYWACKIGNKERLREEAHLLGSLQHPCFPRCHAYWQWENKGVLIMEYICGKTLEEWLREGQIAYEVAEDWCLTLMEALKYLHDLPKVWIYRDLKPSNVVIRQDGKLKLVDMGCACPISLVSESRAGTPGYCAPEQLQMPEKVNTYSDYYSLGLIIRPLLSVSRRKRIKEHWKYLGWKSFWKKCLIVNLAKRKRQLDSIINSRTVSGKKRGPGFGKNYGF